MLGQIINRRTAKNITQDKWYIIYKKEVAISYKLDDDNDMTYMASFIDNDAAIYTHYQSKRFNIL